MFISSNTDPVNTNQIMKNMIPMIAKYNLLIKWMLYQLKESESWSSHRSICICVLSNYMTIHFDSLWGCLNQNLIMVYIRSHVNIIEVFLLPSFWKQKILQTIMFDKLYLQINFLKIWLFIYLFDCLFVYLFIYFLLKDTDTPSTSQAHFVLPELILLWSVNQF